MIVGRARLISIFKRTTFIHNMYICEYIYIIFIYVNIYIYYIYICEYIYMYVFF